MQTLYQFGVVLVIDEDDDKQGQELKKTLIRIKDAIQADPKCKALVTDKSKHKLVEWDGT